MSVNTITVPLEDIISLTSDGKSFLINPDAEESILRLLKLQETVEIALTKVKQAIKTEGESASPGFTGVRGSKIRVGCRFYGSEYKVDVSEASMGHVDTRLFKKSVSVKYLPEKTAVEEFLKDKGTLPFGILKNERVKQVSITPIEQLTSEDD